MSSNSSSKTSASAGFPLLGGGGELGALIRAHDWSQTPLGPIEQWSQSLQTAVGIVLGAVTPLAVYWGDDLILLYNDAWRTLIGVEHPDALGRPAREVLPEVWEEIGPLFEQVLAGQGAVEVREQLLPFRRESRIEEAWFDYSFNPIPGVDGRVGGVLHVARETMEPVRAQRALRESEVLYRTLAANLPGGAAFILDRDLRYVLAEGEALEGAGFTPTAFEGRTLWEALDPAVTEEYEPLFRQALQGKPFAYEHTSHGRHYISRGAPVRDASGAVHHILVVSYDITERKQAEEAMRQSEERFRMAASAAKLGAYARNLQTGEDYWSPEFLAVCGLQPGERLSLRDGIPAAVHPLDRTRVLDEVRARMECVDAPEFSSEHRIVRADGAVRWVRLQGRMEFDAEGRPLSSSGFIMDVTEHKQAEEALRESERQYRILSEVMEIERAKLTTAIDVLPVGVVIADTEGTILSMNETGLRLHGFASSQEMIAHVEEYGKRFELRDLDGTEISREEWPAARAERGEFDQDREVRLGNLKIGGEYDVSYTVVPVRDGRGDLLFFLYVMEDITERKRAEQQLQESVAQFEALYTQMTEGLVLFDPEGHLLDMNHAALAIHGFDSVESLRRHLEELTDVFELFDLEGDFLPTAEWPIGRVLRGESFDAYEVRVRRLDTGRTWIGSYGGTPVYGPEGELLLAIVTLRDVTAQRETEEALRRYTERLRFLHEVDEAILSAGSAQEVAEAVVERVPQLLPDCLRASVVLNHLETDDLSLLAAFSRSEESLLRTGWRGPADGAWESVLEELQEGHTHVVEDLQALPPSSPLMEALQDEGVRAQVYVPLLIHDEFVGTLNLSMIRPGEVSSDQLEVVNELAVQLSIGLEQARLHEEVQRYTEELEALVEQRTAELQAQYAQLEAVLRTTADGFVITDLSGALLHRNPIAQTWLEQVLPASDVARLEEAVRGLARRAESQPDQVLELTGLDLHLKAAPLDRSNGNAGVVVALQDVSSLKDLERMRSQFITDVSHELRTPVTTIALYAQLLEQNHGEKQAQYLAALETESKHLGALIEEIVYFSRIAGGNLELSEERVDLAEVVQGVLAEYRRRVAEQGVALDFATSEPPPTVSADREKLERVFHNLVDNATRYTTEGMILVNVTTAEWSGEIWAMVSVADTGSGIAPEELPHIFERFFRGAPAHQQQISGSGLGLAVAKELVELHGGWITVESQMGEGSTFTVWLPLAP